MVEKTYFPKMSLRDKLTGYFIIGISFWLINISHTNSSLIWNQISASISGIAILFLLFSSFHAIRERDALGWTYFFVAICMTLSYILFILPSWFY